MSSKDLEFEGMSKNMHREEGEGMLLCLGRRHHPKSDDELGFLGRQWILVPHLKAWHERQVGRAAHGKKASCKWFLPELVRFRSPWHVDNPIKNTARER